jgi:hypothetical protein
MAIIIKPGTMTALMKDGTIIFFKDRKEYLRMLKAKKLEKFSILTTHPETIITDLNKMGIFEEAMQRIKNLYPGEA